MAKKKKNIYKFWWDGKKYEFLTILTRIDKAWENMGGTDGVVDTDEYDYDTPKEDRFWTLTLTDPNEEFSFELKFKKFKNGVEDWQFDKPFEITVERHIDGDDWDIVKEHATYESLTKKPTQYDTDKLTKLVRDKRKRLEAVNEQKRRA